MSSEPSSCNYDLQFSARRYFINNLDSYHGEYILKEMSKVLQQNVIESNRQSSQTLLGEAEPVSPPPPVQPYEIIGTCAVNRFVMNSSVILVHILKMINEYIIFLFTNKLQKKYYFITIKTSQCI